MRDFLAIEVREDLRKRHRVERDRRVVNRIKAVLLADKGWSFRQIAEALLLDEDTISHHVKEYQQDLKLKPENGGSLSKLDACQMQELVSPIEG